MTKKEAFAKIRERIADDAELVSFVDHEVELLNKKATSAKKPTKTQIENDGYKNLIIKHLAAVDTTKTIKELQAEIPEISGLTNQRVTHLLTDLTKAEILSKQYIKKTPYFCFIPHE